MLRAAAVGIALGVGMVALLWAGARRPGPARRIFPLLAVALALAGLAWNAKTLATTRPSQAWDFRPHGRQALAVALRTSTMPPTIGRSRRNPALPYEIDQEFDEVNSAWAFITRRRPSCCTIRWGFEYETAHALWVVFSVVVLAADRALLYLMFLRGRGWEGMAAAGALFLLFPRCDTRSTSSRRR
ncbi:hypothetical protein HS125_10535 [bacterium]|nr:hypothetical protein [bacterium]